MDSMSVVMIIVLCLLIMLSAYFSATETAFTSLNSLRMRNEADGGNKRAKLVLKLLDQYDALLSTILIGNNIVNITSASLATVLFIQLVGEDIGVTLSTVVMTVLVLIFGEISPKSMAKESPEAFAKFSAPIIQVLVVLFTPLNWLFGQWKKLLSRMLRVGEREGATTEELMTMVDEVQNEGGINAHEGELIRAAIEFNDLDAADILTPRVDLTAAEENDPPTEIARMFRESGHSRLPVYSRTIDHIIGILHEKDFYSASYQENRSLRDVLSEAYCTTENAKISALLREMQRRKVHMAVVVDEFGGTVGIVTLEDILEELVGDIWDEHDEVTEEFRMVSDDEYIIDGGASAQEFCERFDFPMPADVVTVGGWVVEQMERIPEEGEQLILDGRRITVVKMEQQRVMSIRICFVSSETDGEKSGVDKAMESLNNGSSCSQKR